LFLASCSPCVARGKHRYGLFIYRPKGRQLMDASLCEFDSCSGHHFTL